MHICLSSAMTSHDPVLQIQEGLSHHQLGPCLLHSFLNAQWSEGQKLGSHIIMHPWSTRTTIGTAICGLLQWVGLDVAMQKNLASTSKRNNIHIILWWYIDIVYQNVLEISVVSASRLCLQRFFCTLERAWRGFKLHWKTMDSYSDAHEAKSSATCGLAPFCSFEWLKCRQLRA